MNSISLILLIPVLLASVSVVWFTLSLGISPMPSSRRVRLSLFAVVDELAMDSLADLGSGWGSLVIPLARRYPGARVTGYEASWVPWFYSLLLKQAFGLKNLTLKRDNFLDADLSDQRLLICYLFRGGMDALEQKLESENRRIPHVLSHTFAFPSRRPDRVFRIDGRFSQTPLYLYASPDEINALRHQ